MLTDNQIIVENIRLVSLDGASSNKNNSLNEFGSANWPPDGATPSKRQWLIAYNTSHRLVAPISYVRVAIEGKVRNCYILMNV